MAKRKIGSLWIGGPLTWLEHVCLKSFADNGHDITLFTYSDIGPVPKGVTQRSGRDILDTDDFIKHKKKDSYALFSDLFRMHMVHKNPGMVWVDSDTYCLRPLTLEDDHIYGFEGDKGGIAGGVLSAPPDGALLTSLMTFMEDLYPIPPFFPRKVKAYQAAKDAGTPVHVSEMPWGTWGPPCLTWFARQTNTYDLAQPVDVFHPVPYGNRRAFLKDPSRVQRFFTERSTAINVYGSNKVICYRNFDGLPPEGSFFTKILDKHEINAADFPILAPGRVDKTTLLTPA